MTIFEGSLSLDGFPNIFRPTQEPIYAVRTHPVTPFKTHCSWLITQGCCSLLKVNARHFCAKKKCHLTSIFTMFTMFPPQRIWGLGSNLVTVAIFIPTNGDLVVVAPKIPQWFFNRMIRDDHWGIPKSPSNPVQNEVFNQSINQKP